MILTDTHPLLWWFFEKDKLSKQAMNRFEEDEIAIPTMSLLEIQYLVEIGRVETDIAEVMAFLAEQPSWSVVPFDSGSLLKAVRLSDTRDPFDRTIAATALHLDVPIITRDRWMQRNLPEVVW